MQFENAFSKLTAPEREILRKGAARRKFKAGAVIIEQGRPNHAIYVVAKGEVRIEHKLRVIARYRGAKGEARAEADGPVPGRLNVEIARLGEGALFGEISFLDHGPASASVVANGRVEALRIDTATIERLMADDPSFAGRFYHSLAATLALRLRATSKRVTRGS